MAIGDSKLPVHHNPFNGKCIHGQDGAIIHKGILLSPKCGHCAGEIHAR